MRCCRANDWEGGRQGGEGEGKVKYFHQTGNPVTLKGDFSVSE